MLAMEISDKDIERFWRKVLKTDTCWLWTTAEGVATNYGTFGIQGRSYRSHRVSYTLAKGPIPEGLFIDHICNVIACVNPAHLRLATPKQNAENISTVTHWNETGIRGVTWDRGRKKFSAKVGHHGKSHFLGYFTDVKEAERVVIAKRNELFTHNDRDRLSGVDTVINVP